jgi:kinetochore protein Mis13/DSN1
VKTAEEAEAAPGAKKTGRPRQAKERVAQDPELTAAEDGLLAAATIKPKPGRRKVGASAAQNDAQATTSNRGPRKASKKPIEEESAVEGDGANGPSRARADRKGKATRSVRQMEFSPEGVAPMPAQSAKIALPMSDTPIINRNKEMRKKGNTNRRSSLGSRGRRASSLIDNGQSAIPHREVNASEFYKHIEANGLPEPRRMKQLLTWCGERSLSEKPRHGTPNSTAIHGGMSPIYVKLRNGRTLTYDM